MKTPNFQPFFSFRNDFFEVQAAQYNLTICPGQENHRRIYTLWNEKAIEVMETPCAANVKPEETIHTRTQRENAMKWYFT